MRHTRFSTFLVAVAGIFSAGCAWEQDHNVTTTDASAAAPSIMVRGEPASEARVVGAADSLGRAVFHNHTVAVRGGDRNQPRHPGHMADRDSAWTD